MGPSDVGLQPWLRVRMRQSPVGVPYRPVDTWMVMTTLLSLMSIITCRVRSTSTRRP